MKILFTDLDGTLLNDDSKVSEYSYEVLKRMTKAGHKLVIASGRPLESIKEVIRLAHLDMPGVYITANNGSLIYDCDNDKVIYEDPVPLDIVPAIWKLAEDEDIHIQTYTETEVVTVKDDAEIRKYVSKIHIPIIYTSDPLAVIKKAPSKMLAISLDDPAKLEKFRQSVLKRYADIVDALYSNSQYLEIYSNTAGKGEALKWLCDRLGVLLADSYAAGDAMNDISMIEAAGHGIVMCNASEDVKKYADIVTKHSNDEDGLAEVIVEEILG